MTVKANGHISSFYLINFFVTFQATDIDDAFLFEILSFLCLLLYNYIPHFWVFSFYGQSLFVCHLFIRSDVCRGDDAESSGRSYELRLSRKDAQNIHSRVKWWLDSLIQVNWQSSLRGRWSIKEDLRIR